MSESVSVIKSSHAPGKTGLQNYHDLNGNEVQQYIKSEKCAEIIDKAISVHASSSSSSSSSSLSVCKRLEVMRVWMKGLNDHLLHVNKWTDDALSSFSSLVTDIHTRWHAVTGLKAFPKLHMLRHTLEFAQRHKFLGCMSEAFIESSHVKFNVLHDDIHINVKNNVKERLRRSLADMALCGMQAVLLQ